MLSKLLSIIGFLYKVEQKIGCFSSYVLDSFSRIDLKNGELERPKFATVSHQNLVSNMILGIFDVRFPSRFLPAFSHKTKMLTFVNTKYLETSCKQNKIQKS